MRERLRCTLTFLALTALALVLNIFVDYRYNPYVENVDFDIHYHGAVIERSSTYTDVEAVRRLQLQTRIEAQPEGVVGTPALVAVFYEPLTLLPLQTAEHLGRVIAIVIVIIGSLSAFPRRHWPYIPAVFCLGPVVFGLHVGNFSVVTFGLVAFAYGALRRTSLRSAGMALGLAAVLKAFPAVLLVALVANREWQALRWAAGTACAVTALALAVMGPRDFALGMQYMLDYSPFNTPRYFDNMSLPGIFYQHFGQAILAKMFAVTLLVGGSVLVLRKPFMKAEHTLAAMCCVLLLGNALSWSHYFGLAVLAVIAISDREESRNDRVRRWACIAVLGLAFGNGMPEMLTFATAALWGMLMTATALRRQKPLHPLPSSGN
jgi:hypothetical protein